MIKKHYIPFVACLLCSMGLTVSSYAQILMVGFNADGNDDIAFVATSAIAGGTVIYFSDNLYNTGTNAFSGGEGYVTYTAPAGGLVAGTVVQIYDPATPASVTASQGTAVVTGSFNIGGSGEQLYAYEGTSTTAPTTFYHTLNTAASWPANTQPATGISTILSPTNLDNWEYSGTRSLTNLSTNITLAANWQVTDGTGDQSILFDLTAFATNNCSITAVTATNATACNDNSSPSTTTDDYYFADITVTFSNPPATGTLDLSGADLYNPPVSVSTSSLTTTHTFTAVQLFATGSNNSVTAAFSDMPACTFTNSTIPAVSNCSVPPCAVNSISLSNVSACNDNGTPANTADDFYTANVTVTYNDPPSSGSLVLSGSGSASATIFTLNSATQHIFNNVQLPANGSAGSITATFSALPTCTFTQATGAVSNCSLAPPCNISALTLSNTGVCQDNVTPNNTTDDFYLTDVSVSFANAPATGNLVLSGSGSATVAVASLGSSTSHTFTGVQLPANGSTASLTATFSAASPACTFTNSSIAAVGTCSTLLPCSITNISLSNTSACNNNGTALNPADDYYTATITVTFGNAPFSGTLNLSGDGTASISVGSLTTSSTHVFTNVQLPTNGAAAFNTLTATFSADAACTYTQNNLPSIASCAVCSISSVSLTNVSACNNNGTTPNAADDTYTADVIVTFDNPPLSGTLDLSGDATASVAVASLSSSTTHTFTNITLPADGTANTLTAAFSADAGCSLTNASLPAVNSCSGVPSFSLSSCGISVTENFNGFAGTAASLMQGWTSSSMDYIPGGYYAHTDIYNASNSTYALGSAADAAYGVKLPTSGSPEDLSYCVTNNTGSPILSMNVAWNVEQYSEGQRATTVDFFYSTNGGTSYTQTNITGTTLTTASVAATSANLPTVTVTPRSIVINGLSVAAGASFCFRFRFSNATGSGSNAHIGVDDLVVTPNCTAPCNISSVSLSNISTCNDNGTPNNLTDDTYTADVNVSFTDAPNTGNLVLSGDGSATVAVGSLGSSMSHTFTSVTLPADGTVNSLTATFSANASCTFTNSTIAAVNSCSVPVTCAISGIGVTAGACNNNGTTATTADDYYLASVTVTYTNPETTGDLVLSGDGSAMVAVGSLGSSTSHTFTDIQLPADGTANSLTATFSANASCTFTNNTIAVVNSCSVPLAVIQLTACNTPSATETYNDYAGTAATVPTGWTVSSSLLQSGVYNNTGALGTANGVFALVNGAGTEPALGAKVAANSGNPTGTGLATFEFCTTNQTGTTLDGVGLAWDVEQYSQGLRASIVDVQYKVDAGAYAAVSGSAVTAQTNAVGSNITPPLVTPKTANVLTPVAPAAQVCLLFSVKTGSGSGNNAHIGIDNLVLTPLCCNITNISLSNISSCNNNSTIPNSTDDYYTADVTVTFANAPASGNLVLSGDASLTEAVINLDGATSHTFSGVQLPADGTNKTLTATFSANSSCTYTNSAIAAVASCSSPVCSIASLSIAPIASSCSDNGTPADATDDYYLADVTVSYANRPASGTLNLSGDALAGSVINPNVVFLGSSSYVYSAVKIKADNASHTLNAAFSANAACTANTTATATAPCSAACPASFGTFH